nr:hypothetical protein [Peptoniphilus lacydonensis]
MSTGAVISFPSFPCQIFSTLMSSFDGVIGVHGFDVSSNLFVILKPFSSVPP